MTNKKEKTTSKTIKTVFFVSTIVVFTVSVSTTNIQLAEAVTSDVILEKIQEIKDRTNFKESMNADELKEKQKLFQRLNLAKELVTLQSSGLGDSQEATKVTQQIRDEFAEYTPVVVEDFPPPPGIKELGTEQLLPLQLSSSAGLVTQNLMADINIPTITVPEYVYQPYDVSDVSRTSCNTLQIGDSNGSITAYSNYSYLIGNLVGPQDHPTIIWDACQPKTFDNGVILYYNFEEPRNSCIQHFDSVHHARGGICSGITTNHLILIDVEANYQGTEFSSTHGTQWIVL